MARGWPLPATSAWQCGTAAARCSGVRAGPLAMWAACGHRPRALLVCEGLTITSYNAITGAQNWQVHLTPTPASSARPWPAATARPSACSPPTGWLRLRARCQHRRRHRHVATGGQDLGLTSNGALVAVATTNQLKVYSLANGLQWIFQGDSYVRFPRFSAVTRRSSAPATWADGRVRYQRQQALRARMGALCAAAWVPRHLRRRPDPRLLGRRGLSSHRRELRRAWSTLLQPTATDIRGTC